MPGGEPGLEAAFVAKLGGSAFAELGAALATDNDLPAGERVGPCRDLGEVAPD
jgi:hypothetical protein